jgi:hypothetical protein
VILCSIDLKEEFSGTVVARDEWSIRANQQRRSMMSVGSVASSGNSAIRLLSVEGLKKVRLSDLPGGEERAKRLIENAVRIDASRKDSIQAYQRAAVHHQNSVQRLTAIIENLPADTTRNVIPGTKNWSMPKPT